MHSPFTSTCNFTPRKRSLFLQFLIDALESGDTSKVEHLLALLPFAFPEMPHLKKLKRKKLEFLIPFLEQCKDDEGLILFLLRRNKIHLLHNICFEELKSKFQERGFYSLADELGTLADGL